MYKFCFEALLLFHSNWWIRSIWHFRFLCICIEWYPIGFFVDFDTGCVIVVFLVFVTLGEHWLGEIVFGWNSQCCWSVCSIFCFCWCIRWQFIISNIGVSSIVCVSLRFHKEKKNKNKWYHVVVFCLHKIRFVFAVDLCGMDEMSNEQKNVNEWNIYKNMTSIIISVIRIILKMSGKRLTPQTLNVFVTKLLAKNNVKNVAYKKNTKLKIVAT